MIPSLESFLASDRLQPLDVHFSRAMGRLAGETRPLVLLAAALVSRQVRDGHVCLPAAELSALLDPAQRAAAGDPLPAQRPAAAGSSTVENRDGPSLDATAAILAGLKNSALVSDGSTSTPLVLDAAHRIYLRRYWQYEQTVAQVILRLSQEPAAAVDDRLLEDGLMRLFGPAGEEDPPDLQRLAASRAVKRCFCVISGGPGTGKTFTVAKILALLLEQAAAMGKRPPRLLLVAPTGKAAARLEESLAAAARHLNLKPEIKACLVLQASTIHRALGASGSMQFRRSAASPLVADLVLVDEASMVHVSLMARLMESLPRRARLVLMGDRDQLASVEAGAVLGDICNKESLSDETGAKGDGVPLPGGGVSARGPFNARRTDLSTAIVHLTRSYRYKPESGIAALAEAINGGHAGKVLEILASPRYPDVSLAPPQSSGPLNPDLRQAILAGYKPYLEAGSMDEKFAAFARFRILCGHRHGPSGVERLNRTVVDLFRSLGIIQGEVESYTGRPIMVTVNDAERGLWNGDVGLVQSGTATEGARVFFGGPGDGGRTCSLSRLPAHEDVFAMTVHKSQGSEFHRVVILLPEVLSPVICRELFYTAVTRSRERVMIHADPELVRQAVECRIRRFSGLRAILWGE